MKHHKRIFTFIRTSIRKFKTSPTFQEIANATSIDMLTVYCAVQAMIYHGTLKRSNARARYITLP